MKFMSVWTVKPMTFWLKGLARLQGWRLKRRRVCRKTLANDYFAIEGLNSPRQQPCSAPSSPHLCPSIRTVQIQNSKLQSRSCGRFSPPTSHWHHDVTSDQDGKPRNQRQRFQDRASYPSCSTQSECHLAQTSRHRPLQSARRHPVHVLP